MNYKFEDYVISYPDFPKPGVLYRDIFPLVAKVDVFKQLIDHLAKECQRLQAQKILSIEARGFIVGSALSLAAGIPMVPARKFGKLPGSKYSYKYNLEYGNEMLEISTTSISEGEKVVLVDDVLATGGTASASINLCKMAKANPIALLAIIELGYLGGRAVLEEQNIEIFSLINYKN